MEEINLELVKESLEKVLASGNFIDALSQLSISDQRKTVQNLQELSKRGLIKDANLFGLDPVKARQVTEYLGDTNRYMFIAEMHNADLGLDPENKEWMDGINIGRARLYLLPDIKVPTVHIPIISTEGEQ